MASVPFSIPLDTTLRSRLENEARTLDRSPSDLALRAIEAFLDARDAKRHQIETAAREADDGIFVSAEAVARWMDRWDDDPEAAPPAPDVTIPPR